jgi:hypothetical protein
MDHADADVRFADLDVPHLLIDQAFGDGLLRVSLKLAQRDVVPRTHGACRLRISWIDFRLCHQGRNERRGQDQSDRDCLLHINL